MKENFRQFLDRLRQAGELVDLHQAVDIRHIATLVDQANTALYFHNVIGYDMPVVSGIIRSRERAIMSLGCETYREIEDKLAQAIAKPIPPKYVQDLADPRGGAGRRRRRSLQAADPDVVDLRRRADDHRRRGDRASDPELGINSGIYRFIVKEKSLTGIDIVTPNNMRLFAQRAFERGEPLPISISHRHASDRDHRLGLSRAARRRRDGDRRRHSRRRRSSSRPARPSTCPTSPTPRSCWRRKSCRPAGPGRKAASASSPG